MWLKESGFGQRWAGESGFRQGQPSVKDSARGQTWAQGRESRQGCGRALPKDSAAPLEPRTWWPQETEREPLEARPRKLRGAWVYAQTPLLGLTLLSPPVRRYRLSALCTQRTQARPARYIPRLPWPGGTWGQRAWVDRRLGSDGDELAVQGIGGNDLADNGGDAHPCVGEPGEQLFALVRRHRNEQPTGRLGVA